MFSPVINFFYGWYIDDTRNFWQWFANYLKFLDREVGLIGNLQNWTSPLFGDYSYIGRVIGPIFRTMRIFFGMALFVVVTIFSVIIYLFWIILPIAVIVMIALNFIALFEPLESDIASLGVFLRLFI